jgi:hypothetical protein
MAADFGVHDCEGRDIQQTLSRWRDSARARAARADWFWSRQQACVMSKIAKPSTSGVPKLAWASLAATIALAASLVLPVRPEKPVQPQALASPVAQISDHDLLVAVERSMNAGVPSSLAPATLLADEMNQALATKAQSQKAKESRYEN